MRWFAIPFDNEKGWVVGKEFASGRAHIDLAYRWDGEEIKARVLRKDARPVAWRREDGGERKWYFDDLGAANA
jgi:hypothetical protein